MGQEVYQALDRRPLASRERKASRAVARWLAGRGTSPNAISLAGMGFGLAGGAALAGTALWPQAERILWLAAAACVQCRLLANLFDGMVAVERGIASPLGELYNEVPDRISDPAILSGLGFAAGGDPLLGLAASCAALFVAYLRAVGKAAGGPQARQEFCGPMAKQQRMFVVTVVAVYSGLAPAAWQPQWSAGLAAGRPRGLAAAALAVIILGCLVTALRRLKRIAGSLMGQKPR